MKFLNRVHNISRFPECMHKPYTQVTSVLDTYSLTMHTGNFRPRHHSWTDNKERKSHRHERVMRVAYERGPLINGMLYDEWQQPGGTCAFAQGTKGAMILGPMYQITRMVPDHVACTHNRASIRTPSRL